MNKNGEKHFSNKNHTKVEKWNMFIKKGETFGASVHDFQPVKKLVDKRNKNCLPKAPT